MCISMSITKQNVTSVSNLQKDFFLCDPKMPWNVASCIASLPALAGKLQTQKTVRAGYGYW